MSVEERRGRLYWYERRRVGGKVRAEYHGPVPPEAADLLRAQADDRMLHRLIARQEREAATGAADAVLAVGKAFDRLADRVFRAAMYLTGHRLHKRSEWRRKRGEEPMGSLAGLFKDPDEPKPALVTPWSENPETKKLLDRAAKGDTAVLPAVRELFKNGRILDQVGSAAGMALTTMIAQAAGANVAVAEAMVTKYHQYIDGLLADGDPKPTLAERWTATRAAHNWLAVHILECIAAKYQAGGPTAVAIDRRVTQADRRLHAALKSLAVLRRLRKPAVVAQVNVAAGPMVVDNRGCQPANTARGEGGPKLPPAGT